MDEINYTKQKKPHPIENANHISRIFFCWLIPFFIRGVKKQLSEDDIYATRKSDEAGMLGNKLEKIWKYELTQSKNPSLWKCIFLAFKWEIILLGINPFIVEVMRILQPLLISKLLTYYENTDGEFDRMEASIYGGLLVLVCLLVVLLVHNFQLRAMALGMRIRVAACSLIYRKAVKLNKTSLAETTIGQMVNLLSNDVGRFDFASQHFHYLWIAPIEILIIMVLIYMYVDISGLVGTILMFIMVPFYMYMGKKIAQYRLRTALRTDERIRLMNEILTGIQIIKMYTWEKPFTKMVELIRWKEIQQIKATSTIRAILLSILLILGRCCVYLCILTYFLTGNIITASYAYTIISFYNVIKNTTTMWFPQALQQFAECTVSAKRIQNFLLFNEVNEKLIPSLENMNGGVENFKEIGVSLKNVSVKWLSSLSENSLENIDFQASLNQLIAVVGPVGCGKTTLLQTILQEIEPVEGNVIIHGKISYASQEPWLFAGSIRQNIIFGQTYDEDKYEEVIRVCALKRDIKLFPHGDYTLVGERGVSLSGGQKARINLARAVYMSSDIYLLDDPLSAVDTHVGKQLFDKCICGYLKNKCVILVTHQLQYLKKADGIYLLEDGKITTSGTYQELKSSGNQFTKLLAVSKEEKKEGIESMSLTRSLNVKDANKESHANGIVIQEREHRETGDISSKVYFNYFKAGGNWCTSITLALLFVLFQVGGSGVDYFITLWVNYEQSKKTLGVNSNSTVTSFDSLGKFIFDDYVIYIYSALVFSNVIIVIVRSVWFYRFCVNASKKLHNNMFKTIIHTSMSFFNTNPSGRILNRFSKDMGAVDEVLPISLIDTIQLGLQVLAISLVNGYLSPWIFLPTTVILIVFYLLRQIFLASSRDIKRIEAVTRSPIFTHLAATLQGLTTIRAFRAQNVLTVEFDNYQDRYSAAYFLFLTANRTFGFWLDFHCIIYIGLVTVAILFIENETFGGNAGLALTQSMMLTGMFQWGMRQWSELVNQMTSVERVQEYAEIPPEPDNYNTEPSRSWPEEGNVQFDNLSLRYSTDAPYVLKNLTFKVSLKEKIGIVGRTGAGKSSIIQALFRLAPTDGQILIDGVDIKNIPLKTLRSSISIIPQESILFSGTLRKNLDPFDEYSDEVLWNALEEVELKNVVEDLPAGLEGRMAEGGSNFSVGQRQLLCLARAILRSNKILVLDEATANVDPHTDSLIQKTIRRKFIDCTVLTIAHRMHTIMDSDKVLVMDAGVAVEFDHPYVLLLDENGVFPGLVKETGVAMAEQLRSMAKENYEKLNN